LANPTYVKDLVNATLVLLEKNLNGIFNVAGPEVMDRETLAKRMAKFFNLDLSLIQGEPTTYFEFLAPRPLNSGLKINKIQELGITMRTVEDALKDMQENKEKDDKYE